MRIESNPNTPILFRGALTTRRAAEVIQASENPGVGAIVCGLISAGFLATGIYGSTHDWEAINGYFFYSSAAAFGVFSCVFGKYSCQR